MSDNFSRCLVLYIAGCRKFYFIIIVLTLTYIEALGQSQSPTQVPPQNIVGPSPNASSLGKFGDIPVGYATGVPNIFIPLYELKLSNLDLPVTLNYHAGGIKVEEVAGWVGLGWALDCGGVITRTISGNPDEDPDGYFATAGQIPDPNTDYQGFLGWEPTDTYLHAVVNHVYDSEPDMYFFNFMGASGKMILDVNQQVSTVPYRNLKITSGFNAANQWTIVNEQGTTFIFGGTGATETSEADMACGTDGPSPFNRITSWYLKKVISAKGDTIGFQYSNYPSSYYGGISYTRYDNIGLANPYNIAFSCTQAPSQCQAIIGTSNLYLSKVGWKNGSLEFSASLRQDFSDMYKLDRIDLKNANGAILKSFNLSTSYFLGGEQRLRLDGVNLTDNNGTTEHYGLTYNTQTALPARTSTAQDFWGFYNGKISNTTLIPSEIGACAAGADRTPDPVYCQAGILTSITYPTGGSTAFNFESNTYGYQQILGDIPMPVTENDITIPYTSNVSVNAWGSNQSATANFTVGISQCATVTYNFGKRAGSLNPDPPTAYCTFTRLADGANMLAAVPNNAQPTSIQLNPGQYQITGSAVDPDNFASLFVNWNVTASTASEELTGGGLRIKTMTNNDGRGNSSVKNFTYHTSADNSRSSGVMMNLPNYHYTTYQERPLPTPPQGDGSGPFGTFECTYTLRQSATVSVLGSTQGGTLSYSEVTVNNDQGSLSKGSSWYNYTSALDFPDIGRTVFPFPLKTSYDWRRGLLKQTNDYNAAGILLKSEVNQYTFNNPSTNAINYKTIPAIKVGVLKSNLLDHSQDVLQFDHYQVISEWFYQSSSTVTQYDQNGLNPIVTTTNYSYDNPVHAQLTQTTNTQSDGKLSTSVSLYPDDYSPGTVFIDYLKTNHIIGIPIERIDYLNVAGTLSITDGLISQYLANGGGLVDKYYKFETSATVPLSTFKFSNNAQGVLPFGNNGSNYAPDTRYTERLTFNSYDNVGNPSAITVTNGPSTSYQWGYNHEYPVAEVKNAPVNDIFYDSFEEGNGNSAVNDSKTGHYSYNGSTTSYSKILKNLDAGNYTLSYWLRQTNGTWSFVTSTVPVTGISYTITLTGQIDDVRFYPAVAQMTSYTYDPLVGITSMADAKSDITYYEYDSFQRLINIKDYLGNIVKSFCYNYAGQTTGCSIPAAPPAQPVVYQSDPQSGPFTKTCDANSTGTTVTYSLPGGMFTSTISIADADQQALAYLNANGPAYANSNGSCTPNAAPTVAINLNNTTNSGYQANFSNSTTSITLTFNNNGTVNPAPTVPAGTYNVIVYPTDSGPEVPHTIELTGVPDQTGTPRATFLNYVVAPGPLITLLVY